MTFYDIKCVKGQGRVGVVSAVEPSFFEICKMNKTGLICMSVAFHSRIECENWPKNEQAMQKKIKIT